MAQPEDEGKKSPKPNPPPLGTIPDFITPYPLLRVHDPLHSANPNISGEIKFDEHGMAFQSYLRHHRPGSFLVDGFNYWVQIELQEQVRALHLRIPEGNVFFVNVTCYPPKSDKGPIYPQEARDRGLTYAMDMQAQMLLVEPNGNERIDPEYMSIGKMPVMLGSSWCWLGLQGHQEECERLAIGECGKDPFGYFIVKGGERVILLQEKLRVNRPMVFSSDSKTKTITCRMTNNTIQGSTVILVIYDQITQWYNVHLHFMEKDIKKNVPNTIVVFQVYRMLASYFPDMRSRDSATGREYPLDTVEGMWAMISPFIRPEHRRKIYVSLVSSFHRLIQPSNDFETLSAKRGVDKIGTQESRRDNIIKAMMQDLFPQITGFDSVAAKKKLQMLSIMVARTAEAVTGLGDPPFDNRDSWGNKRLKSAATIMSQLFHNVWQKIITVTQKEIDDKKLSGLDSVRTNFKQSIIKDEFESSFTTTWGVRNNWYSKRKEQVVDILKRENNLTPFSYITRIGPPTSDKAKNQDVRMTQPSQIGFVDLSHTPEGRRCVSLDTRILLEDGITTIAIGDLTEDHRVMTVNKTNLQHSISGIHNYFKYDAASQGHKLFKITTISGRTIKCTDDHPLFTQRGMVETRDLKVGDDLCVFHTQDEMPNEVEHKIILTSGQINGHIFVPIEKIEEIPSEMVADFTTLSDNHTFIGNSIINSNCGLVKHLASFCYITVNHNPNILHHHFLDTTDALLKPSEYPTPVKTTALLINGTFYGWVEGARLYPHAIQLRRNLQVYPDTMVVLDGNYLHISCEGERPVRPLLIVDPTDEQLVIVKKKLWGKGVPFDTLLTEQCVEYIDPWEQDYVLIAQHSWHLDKVRKQKQDALNNLHEAQRQLERVNSGEQVYYTVKTEEFENSIMLTREDALQNLTRAKEVLQELESKQRFTHCELDPQAILGIPASVIPLVSYNQNPRISYQINMSNQAMGHYHSNYRNRFDSTMKVLVSPSTSIIQTQMEQVIGINEMPYGQMVAVGIMTGSGYNQEDAFVFDKLALDMGLFRMIQYTSYKSIAKVTSDIIEVFQKPAGLVQGKLDHLDENGIPELKRFVKEGDILIGKVRINQKTLQRADASTIVGVGEEGYIDRVMITKSEEGFYLVKVKIRSVRVPIEGDKFAFRPAQKGTIGRIVPHEDMPMDEDGGTVSVMMNPHAIPSRMTNGFMFEILASKSAAMSGESINFSPFRPFNEEEFKKGLVNYGFRSNGKKMMYSGEYGKPFEVEIYTGPAHMLGLRHHVKNKYQMRGKGPTKPETRQPVAGRGRRGGQRLGEMERDAFISHGGMAILRDSLCDRSDAYDATVCQTCDTLAMVDKETKQYMCLECGAKANFGRVRIPWSYKHFSHLLAGMGLNLQVRTKPAGPGVRGSKPLLPKENPETENE